MIELVRSLHDGMSATVTAGGGKPEPFSVRNGLHQGCTIAPTLITVYFGLFIYRWLDTTAELPSRFGMVESIGDL